MARKDYYHVSNAPKPNSIVPAASAVVINDKGQILLHRRKDNNFWSLLGGAMIPGESISETAIREVYEESNIRIKVDKLIGVYSDPQHIIEYSDGEIRQQFSLCFLCSVVSGEIKISKESLEVKFFDLSELNNINLHPAQIIRISDYQKNSEKTFY
ncbi:MAG TPA: NUDIX domain-containing protein [bacterium]|nr:NUDIX domain-containing protein [bacterium]